MSLPPLAGVSDTDVNSLDASLDFFQKMAQLIDEDAQRRGHQGLLERSQDAVMSPVRGRVATVAPAEQNRLSDPLFGRQNPASSLRQDIDPLEVLQAAHRIVTQRMDAQRMDQHLELQSQRVNGISAPVGVASSRAALPSLGRVPALEARELGNIALTAQRGVDPWASPWAPRGDLAMTMAEPISKQDQSNRHARATQEMQGEEPPYDADSIAKKQKLMDTPSSSSAATDAGSATWEPLPEPGRGSQSSGSAPDTPARHRPSPAQPWAAAWTPSPAAVAASRVALAEPWAPPWEPNPAADRNVCRAPMVLEGIRSFAEAAAEADRAEQPRDAYPHSREQSPFQVGPQLLSSSSTASRSNLPPVPPRAANRYGSPGFRDAALPPAMPDRSPPLQHHSDDRFGMVRNSSDRSFPPPMPQRHLANLPSTNESSFVCGRGFAPERGTPSPPLPRYPAEECGGRNSAFSFSEENARGQASPMVLQSPMMPSPLQPQRPPLAGGFRQRAVGSLGPMDRTREPALTQVHPTSLQESTLPHPLGQPQVEERAMLERAILPEPVASEMQNLPNLRPPGSPPRRKRRPAQAESASPALPALSMRGPR